MTRMSLKDLRNRLRFDKDVFDDELVEHAELYYIAASTHAVVLSDRDAQKDYLKHIEGRISSRIRSEIEGKVTVAQVAQGVQADDEWRAEQEKYRDLCASADQWGALKEAFLQRGYMLNNYARFVSAQEAAEENKSTRTRTRR